ncbi:MAG TPA: glycosyltransferase [Fulvivirga sp.]|nr:glycosyltransferase [Fulvivirga sp.]
MNLSNLNNNFDQVFVINLEKRVDRKIRMINKLSEQQISFEFVEAVDGYSDDYVAEYSNYERRKIGGEGAHELEIKYDRKLITSPGAWGYLKTYEQILKTSIEKGYKKILCFDDDVLFHKNFKNEFDKFISRIGNDWKILYLGATQHVWNIPNSHQYSDSKKIGFDPDEAFYHPKATDGSFAIGIDYSVFDLLLQEIQKFNAPFDSGPLRTVNKLFLTKCFVAQPNLVIADVSNSDIGTNRNQYELAEKVKWDMDLYNYPDNQFLVSIIIPAYNAESTITKSIQSILNQTYQNIEVIVADDGSTDNTVETVKKLQSKDPRIQLIENKVNRGCYYVRNDALRLSKGEFIAIQDADDISIPDRIEKQIIPIIKKEAKFTISRIYRSRCTIDEMEIDKPEQMIELAESRRKKNKYGDYEYRDRKILGFNSSMFHRSLFEDIGLFWEYRFAADAEYAERILFHYADITLSENENIHSLLMDCEPIEGLYKRIDEVLVISTDMGDTNITNKHKQQEKKDFETLWRLRLIGEVEYNYPIFEEHEKLLSHKIDNELDKLTVKHNLYKQKLEAKLSAKDQMLVASRTQIQNLQSDLAWYSRTFDHLPKWYLKIGGIFRRWPFNKKS